LRDIASFSQQHRSKSATSQQIRSAILRAGKTLLHSMIPKSGYRFSEKIMLQEARHTAPFSSVRVGGDA
jgi:hypothetical protein